MITFRPLHERDAGLLLIWMSSPHVQPWWTQDGSGPEDELEDALGFIGADYGAAFIVEYNRKPIGYIQFYDPNYAYDGFYFADQPTGAMGVDMFIGDVSLTGQGLGARILRQFSDDLLARGVPKLLIDPDAANAHAIKAYQNAGFTIYAEHDSPRWGQVTLMSKTPTYDA
ncbi:hypothetical protein AEAC466_20470 [Asticcacaulis sp. AC466]|uniref:GNAT family N-acetyltransferase n=1 Tax=Asticcacaulis sp. AC466 TaxID=1282362 RepID=UPI0003C3D0FE|nr:GNAT family N-acetyltransferase [Asticcacaulis sp. AC466]ESQ81672.1 hypothetical protein AEAC466_20470 [Asticcacaulis sp. AC466]